MKKFAVAFLSLCIPFLAFANTNDGKIEKPKQQAAAPAVAAPAVAPATTPAKPSAEFLADFQKLTVLLHTIDDIEKDSGIVALRNQANKIASDLRSRVPEGFQFNPEKQDFVPAPKPVEQKPAEKK